MSRWPADTAERLHDAALELFLERGYENTSAAEIAERAGVAKSTFFRHFTDKREVLFAAGQDLLADRSAKVIAGAPAEATTFDLLDAALRAMTTAFDQERRAWYGRRQLVITQNHELRERDLLKREALTAALVTALHQRGLASPAADLAAEIAHLALRTAYARWIDGSVDKRLDELISETLADLRAATAEFG
ncbi:TetR/AcrR family transcriptional regulator [Amycolatopsis sp. GM8]|uniref:TetR/AcrR family transcriptional regulator n=1 Tax=Amycolatopsis sp. GM8 TaxID=2896530 RepID=UPI001F2880D0|nr:TetR/AcrR family transcriptional regulator [Amycolatopsis sp. GM8]